MPNVTLFLPAHALPPDTALSDLTARCTELCTSLLLAALENVHVVYVPVLHGRSRPIFAEVRYRLAAARTPTAMAQFMERLDDAIRGATGLEARIRCFGYAAQCIHARN
ncbi:hypothetical protein A6R71_02300 [Xanthomonas translucens pv. arrhenatheri]|uniref:Uncharacterized protein n=1 Tax=Xanthomonas graminis pv. arrhenatheri LMG 727 TaxID=1195923 RepID=A0A0K2ZTK1_9XANT|nr:hypothetical protein [Xanthomonas translucens]OAX64206.1 hypothetical protein A6R71_02300 [Xanthomonas translucens pv. arrhenatheri]UKE77161.1 hypothetical protein KM317_17335 [Xanthomonas translucens pv. arrhenatheri]CTP87479.1 hypothetical protein XTALMG727_2037 [Xanthomonas translucens pv. arrhenatheri LMG 727]